MTNKQTDDDLRDQFYRIKLRMINERMLETSKNTHEEEHIVNTTNELININRDIKLRQLETELQIAKRNNEKLKEKLTEHKLEKKISLSLSRENSNSKEEHKDSFSKLMEVMVLQQTQMQNMMMNQMYTNAQGIGNFIQSLSSKVTDTKTIAEPVSSIPIDLKKDFKDVQLSYPYPGNAVQKSMRQMALAALFCSIIDNEYDEMSVYLSNQFLFEIKIKEIIATIEKYYIKPGGDIHSLLNQIVADQSPNFKILITRNGTSEELSLAEKELNSVVETLVAKVTEIMPKTGTLGSECKSILSEFLYNNQTFPDKYFFVRELDFLQVDSNNTIHNSGFLESKLLLIGIFFIRTLVKHELMFPVEYRLCSTISITGKENLRILGSLIMAMYNSILTDFFVQRYPNDPRSKNKVTMTFHEMDGVLLSESELQPLLKLVKRSMDLAKVSILKWADTYVMKLRPL